jgi:transposase-like protein
MTNKSERAVSAMSDDEFDSRFPNEKTAIDWFIDMRYNGNLVCPHCGATVSIYRERARLKVFHCSQCNNSFSPIKGTIFEKTHSEIRKWFKVIKNLLNDRAGYSACHVQRDVARVVITRNVITGDVTKKFNPITYKSAWRMLQQIRIAMANREIEQIFEATFEVDETYVGGKPKKTNAILDEKGNVISKPKIKNKRGRGTKKIPVVGIKERETGHVYAKVMLPDKEGKKLSGKQLLDVIIKTCKKNTVINTDEFRSYGILNSKENKDKYIHVTVNHSKGQYVTSNGVHTNGIENFWSVVKNGVRGVYHHISVKYLQRYVDEYSFKQNTRLDSGMFNVLLSQCVLV